MNALTVTSREDFLQQLANAFKEKLSSTQARKVADFSVQYFAHLPLDEMLMRRFSDTYGNVLAAWQFLQQRADGEALVSIFNPDLEEDGWQSTHSVIYILHPNISFLIDSVRIAINQRELGIHTLHHSILKIDRDRNGKLKKLCKTMDGDEKGNLEALIVLEIDRHSNPEDLQELQDALKQVLEEVRIAVSDFPLMRDKTRILLEELNNPPKNLSQDKIEEARAFLQWLTEDHFTFLGYDEYDFVEKKGDIIVQQVPDSELGILRSHNERPSRVSISQLPQKTRQEMTRSDDLFIFAKSAQRSRVHRPAYPDYIAVKKFDSKGRVIGERRFLGLYTARVYNERPDEVPVLRRKVMEVIRRSSFMPDDYAGKELDQILAVYPRDELFQIDTAEILEVALDILYIQERRKIRLFMREDVYGQFVTCLAFFPRDIYTTELRLKAEAVLSEALKALDIEFNVYFSESVLARVQFTVRVPPEENRILPVNEVQEKVIELAQSWRDGLLEAFYEAHGEERGNQLIQLYQNAFPSGYRDLFSPRRAVIDIDHVTRVKDTGRLAMSFYRALEEEENTLHFKLFHPDEPIPLSEVMPIFENLGFRVLGEHPFETIDRSGKTVWIHDFSLQAYSGKVIDIHRIRPIFETLFEKVWYGEAENDTFNRLVLACYLDWRKIAMLRAYARYMRQIRISNSQAFIASTLVNHMSLAQSLLDFFEVRFNPATFQSEAQCAAAQQKLELEFNAGLDDVENLSEDRILRLYLELIKATMRTNFYQPDADGKAKPYISFKFNPLAIPDMPLPVPMFEIFVYSPRVEGVHLRGGKVARGGLRWSDRFEDYRTEILGLVKAQQVKNAVIVPVGAKGGFVAKQLPEGGDRDAIQKEGIESYKTFIHGLLDLTDNFVDGKVVPPVQVIRHDEDDYYLVVAADKGTATFSDIANSISQEFGFWLGDAFASGGSNGYDHKKMGITARGAWVSVERHFRELDINPKQDDFTVVGIGDMSGDVFGNGMLLSRHIKLVAAFNHLHIFVDPNPDAAASFAERERLFRLPRSSWTDYKAELISKGGGIFNRSAKSIPISPEMKEAFGIKVDRMPPNMLINSLLQAEVDLLWVGGIGTYVKSSDETHSEVGDKANDGLRVDACDLRCKVVGEGGNLGLTQLARIEFALEGGRVNTDFIDNAGGVDCSDHEVNAKILLNSLVANGDLTEKQRNVFLEQMTEEVAGLVLQNNYRQTQAISIAASEARTRIEEYRRLISGMESAGKLNRQLEFLPDEELINERKLHEQGLTRPELSTLISYVKGDLKQVLNQSDLPDIPGLAPEIAKMFPAAMVKRFGKELGGHQLRREIISTQIANDMVNHMGITYVDRLRQSTGASPAGIALAWIVARDIYRLDHWWEAIEALDFKISSSLQMQLMTELMRLIRRASRWLLRNRRGELDLEQHMARFSAPIGKIADDLPGHLGEQAAREWKTRYDELVDQGVPGDVSGVVAGAPYLYAALGIVEAHHMTGLPLERVARIYYALGERLQLNWFAQAINRLTPTTHWQALARESFREDLDWQQRALTVGVLGQGSEEEPEVLIERWAEKHEHLIERWTAMQTELRGVVDPEYAMFSVALRELLDLAQTTIHVPVSGDRG
ncbi:NAD-glutamate dehydrogenase [Mangrovitalea sediminis]|uniref:NAD-glutamate dehydrogenase n=1 Tax=Mangrovitalea sediminis TaxID=1982043 RepID=UPI000BE60C1E|nr:NAD-glutamate dehydrogenase [Mangrovitalea sediminis]